MNQPRVQPLVDLVQRLATAGTIHAVDQDQHRAIGTLLQLVLRIQQGLTQRRLLGLVGVLVDNVTELGDSNIVIFPVLVGRMMRAAMMT